MRTVVLLLCLGDAALGQQSRPHSRRDAAQHIRALVEEMVTAPTARVAQIRSELLLFGAAATPALVDALGEQIEVSATGSRLGEARAVEMLNTLAALGSAAAAGVPRMIPLLEKPAVSPILRATREALVAIGAAGVPHLQQGLHTESGGVVAEIARVLQALDARSVRADLRACLPERSHPRVTVLSALIALGEDRPWCMGELIGCLRDDGSGPFGRRDFSDQVPAADRAAEALVACGEAAVPVLVEAMTSPDERVRRNAAWALGRLKSTAAPAVPALRRGLVFEEATGQLTRLWALAQIGPAAAGAAPELVALLRQPGADPMLEQAVVRALTAGGVGSLRWLLPLCEDWDPEVRRRAVGAVGALGVDAAAAVPALVARLSDHSPGVAMAAAAALGRLGPAARDAVVPLLRDEQARRRELAARVLEGLGEQASGAAPALAVGLSDPAEDARRARFAALAAMGAIGVEHLGQALAHPDVEVRRLAARTLGSVGAAAAATAPVLAELVARGEDPAAADAAWALGQLGPLPPAIVARLRTALASQAPELRSRALQALVRTESAPAVSLVELRQALQHVDAQVRLAALQGLRSAGAAAQAATDAIVVAASDPDAAVQREAVSWLGELGPVEPRVVLTLCAALQAEDRYVRFRALAGLSRDAAAVRALLTGIRAAADTDPRTRLLASAGLTALGQTWHK